MLNMVLQNIQYAFHKWRHAFFCVGFTQKKCPKAFSVYLPLLENFANNYKPHCSTRVYSLKKWHWLRVVKIVEREAQNTYSQKQT